MSRISDFNPFDLRSGPAVERLFGATSPCTLIPNLFPNFRHPNAI